MQIILMILCFCLIPVASQAMDEATIQKKRSPGQRKVLPTIPEEGYHRSFVELETDHSADPIVSPRSKSKRLVRENDMQQRKFRSLPAAAYKVSKNDISDSMAADIASFINRIDKDTTPAEILATNGAITDEVELSPRFAKTSGK